MKIDVKEEVREQDLALRPAPVAGSDETGLLFDSGAQPPARRWMPRKLFMALVVLPVAVGAVYNFVIASDRFVSTASFVVRQNEPSSRMIAIVNDGSLSRSDDSSYAIAEFIKSRDAIKVLEKDGTLRRVFGADGVDPFSRFPSLLAGDTTEELYEHFQDYVDANFDLSTGISTISVQAFSPEDARQIAEILLQAAERLVNTLNDRARRDSVDFASDLVEDATKRLQKVQKELTDFRNTENLIAPDNEIRVSNTLMTEMLKQLGEISAQLSQARKATPDNPRIKQLELRYDAVSENVEKLRQEMAGGNESLSRKVEGYDTIQLHRNLAVTTLTSTMTSLDAAQLDARQGRLYLERVVQPNLADKRAYPRRLLNMAMLTLFCLGTYWLVRNTTDLFSDDL